MIKQNVLNYCPNYYIIQNYGFNEEDTVTATVIDNYERFIFTVDTRKSSSFDRVTKLDLAIGKYVSDIDYRKSFIKNSSIYAVTSPEDLTEFADKTIKFYEEYESELQDLRVGNWI